MKFAVATAIISLLATTTAVADSTAQGNVQGEGNFGPVSMKQQLESETGLDDQGLRKPERRVGGYRLFRFFALESLLSNLGSYKLATGSGSDLVNTEFAAFTGNAVGILPFGESGLEFYGRLGAGMLSRHGDSAFPVPEDNENGTVGTLGLGLRFTPVDQETITLTAGYDTYLFQVENSYSSDSYGQSVSMAKLGLQYHF